MVRRTLLGSRLSGWLRRSVHDEDVPRPLGQVLGPLDPVPGGGEQPPEPERAPQPHLLGAGLRPAPATVW